MPSTFTVYNRFTLQATGENTNVWGDILNAVIALIDFAIAGVFASATAVLTLTTANGATDQARAATLNYTGSAPGTWTIPSTAKVYQVRAAAALTLTNGSTSVVVPAENFVTIATDGSSIWTVGRRDFGGLRVTSVGAPTANSDAATKFYVDSQVFLPTAPSYPGLTGNAGRKLQVQTSEDNVQWDQGWVAKSANFTAERGYRYLVDTTAGIVTATLPTDCEDGDEFCFSDGGFTTSNAGWNTNRLIIDPDGQTIMGDSSDLNCRERGATFVLAYDGGDFRVIS